MGPHGPGLAHAVARSLLGALRVPSDAIPLGSVPRSSPISSAPARSVTPDLVDVHRIWRVPGSPREVLAVLRHSHSAGLTMNGSGSAGKHGVVWVSARPPAERVPAGVSSIEVARGPTYKQMTLRRTISASASVRRIVAAIDMLPIVQPGTWVCPEEPVGPVVRLSFRGDAGRVLAEAVQAAGDEVGNCSPMYFSVRGREEKPLAEGASVIGIISQMLGLKLLPG
jgi:hypothetical protein